MSARGDRRIGSLGYTSEILGLPDSAFVLLRDLIVQRTGLYFDDAKRGLLADKLSELVTNYGLTSFLDYYYLLRYDEQRDEHWARLMDCLAVPETYFWRQAEQFDALARVIAPEHFSRSDRPLRIWSAACCTGEEPLSIAMALSEAGWLGQRPIQIIASDGSASMVERARRGVYGERSFRQLPPPLRAKYFRPQAGGWVADAALRSQVDWHVVNIADPDDAVPMASADVIFCRNVFIYFSDDAIRRTVRVFADHMPPTGHLFLGASESLTRLGVDFELEDLGGAFVYVKERQRRSALQPAATNAGTTGSMPHGY